MCRGLTIEPLLEKASFLKRHNQMGYTSTAPSANENNVVVLMP